MTKWSRNKLTTLIIVEVLETWKNALMKSAIFSFINWCLWHHQLYHNRLLLSLHCKASRIYWNLKAYSAFIPLLREHELRSQISIHISLICSLSLFHQLDERTRSLCQHLFINLSEYNSCTFIHKSALFIYTQNIL